ncbi:MAG: hypothetical protein NZO58_12780 [Gemmataceae bacterium]|nr:hypothetical protein [Gemmataceae bacterium]
MLEPLPTYSIRVHRLDPVMADLRLTFAPLPEGVAARGRLLGPRCPGVSTVEISHALRPIGTPPTEYQVLIPEPCWWSPARPYVYEGPVEFWREGTKLGVLWVAVSLKNPGGQPTASSDSDRPPTPTPDDDSHSTPSA